MAAAARVSNITGPIPRFRKLYEGERWQPPPDSDWNPDLPYGGKVYLPRKRLPPTKTQRIIEAAVVVLVVGICVGSYYFFEHLHFRALHTTAWLGAPNSQHFVGQRYLNGKGVEQDHKKAMEWFKLAADQGHPHAAHNLAVGHIKGIHKLQPGEAQRLLQHAAVHGIPEAQETLESACVDGGCD